MLRRQASYETQMALAGHVSVLIQHGYPEMKTIVGIPPPGRSMTSKPSLEGPRWNLILSHRWFFEGWPLCQSSYSTGMHVDPSIRWIKVMVGDGKDLPLYLPSFSPDSACTQAGRPQPCSLSSCYCRSTAGPCSPWPPWHWPRIPRWYPWLRWSIRHRQPTSLQGK